jgi:FHA domain
LDVERRGNRPVFLKYIDFIFNPFRALKAKWMGVKGVHGAIKGDVNRAKALGSVAKHHAKSAQQFAGQPLVPGQQQGAQMQGQQPGPPGMPGAPGAPAGPIPNPPIRLQGFWIFAKKFCTQCEQQLDKTWDSCPYCAQIAAQAAVAPAKLQALKTQAFVIDSSGSPGSMQLLGWLVPLQGPQKGELFTLQPNTIIGTDPKTSTVVLQDKFMSSKHAEIKAENGMWVLRDSGSTNGTYVNNKRVDRHELVDNDFVKFGQAMLKFKSL